MKLGELLKQIYNYLDTIKKPFEKDEKIELIRYMIAMVEDGLNWQIIEKELGKYE